MKSYIWTPPYSQNGMIITPLRIFDCEIGSRIRLLLSKHRIFDYSGSPLFQNQFICIEWMNEWMNEWCIYIALFIVYSYTPKALYNHVGGLSSTTTSVQHPLGWCDGSHRTTAPVRSPHTSYRWREERVIEPIKWMGIIRRPWMIRASGGNLARTPGLHPYSLREAPWDF